MKKRLTKSYEDLLTKTKKEVIQQLGQQFNYYPSSTWFYVMWSFRWWRHKVLYIRYDKNEKVIAVKIFTKYGKP